MVAYEWVIEDLEDEYNDVVDMDHADTYAEALKTAERMKEFLEPGHHIEIGLVREQGLRRIREGRRASREILLRERRSPEAAP
jgi:3,4-dihydroxy-2-butanone 4-phosphate synthase